jgi:hypothetical protein
MTLGKARKEVDWLSKRTDFDTSVDADQSELAALRFGSVNIEEGMRDDRRVGAISDSLAGVKPRWLERSAELDERGGRIAEELRRRVLLLGDAYPFAILKNSLRYSASQSGIYEFCLSASVAESLSRKPFNQLPVAFERLCREISLVLFGPRATSFRTGWPRDKSDGLPVRAKLLFQKIEQLTGEWVWKPDLDLPEDPSPSHFKELGLDLLTWLAMPDDRIGHFFVLGQCACGKSNWFAKRHEPDLKILRRWFKPMTIVDQPLKCLFVPFHLANASMLADVSTAGITLDRARICLLAAGEKRFRRPKNAQTYWALVQLVAGNHVGPFPK